MRKVAHITGDNVKAIIPEINTAPASVSANSLNNEPVKPPINAIGAYTAPKAMVIEITGMAISRVPRMAALNGVCPSLMCRSTFSNTTIASSTTKPIASTRASNVIRFHEKPNNCITNATPISDSGIVIIGIITERREPINNAITTNTISAASRMVLITSWMESLIAIVESYMIVILMVLGMLRSMVGNNSRTSLAMLIGLALGAASIAPTTAS